MKTRAAFTLVELMLGISMTAVVLVAALTGVVSLQKSYSASEQYATGMADQTRVLDYLALDLRRAVVPPVMDADDQGIQITVPDYYRFNSSDPQHQFPVANDAMLNATGDAALYFDPAAPNVTTQIIAYRFLNGSITRNDPWQPLVSNGSGGYVSSGPVTIASSMDAFPTIAADPNDPTGATFHYNVTFHATFQPLATANATNAITPAQRDVRAQPEFYQIRQKAEGRRQKAEGRRQKAEGRNMKTDRRNPDAGFIARSASGLCLRPSAFCLLPSAFERGGALVMVMIIICVLSVVAASLLLTTVSRYHTTFQSATWQESIVAAESGVDMAMNELRKRVVYGPSTAFGTDWTTTSPHGAAYANYGHAFPIGSAPYALSTPAPGVEGNTATQVRVFVDVPGADDSPTDNFALSPIDSSSSYISQVDNPALADPDGVNRSRWWYRIRALGIAGVSGPARPNLEKLDNRLRRLSFFTDWRTGQAVTSPQAARMVEVIVKPLTNFRNALMADVQINLSNQDVLVDSYDSSKGNYSSTTNHGTMGNIATNGALINANHATVDGNAMTNNGTVTAGDNVTGQQSSSFYQELTPMTTAMLNPNWANVPNGGTLTTSVTYVASLDPTNPTTVHLNGINLPDGGKVISLNAPSSITDPTDPTPSFIKIYVQGDVSTVGTSYINLAAGVNVIFYVTGNVNLQGNGILNNSFVPSRLVLNGLQPAANADGTFPARSVTIGTDQDFQGIVYAPNHDLDLALQAVQPGNSVPVVTITPRSAGANQQPRSAGGQLGQQRRQRVGRLQQRHEFLRAERPAFRLHPRAAGPYPGVAGPGQGRGVAAAGSGVGRGEQRVERPGPFARVQRDLRRVRRADDHGGEQDAYSLRRDAAAGRGGESLRDRELVRGQRQPRCDRRHGRVLVAEVKVGDGGMWDVGCGMWDVGWQPPLKLCHPERSVTQSKDLGVGTTLALATRRTKRPENAVPCDAPPRQRARVPTPRSFDSVTLRSG